MFGVEVVGPVRVITSLQGTASQDWGWDLRLHSFPNTMASFLITIVPYLSNEFVVREMLAKFCEDQLFIVPIRFSYEIIGSPF
jgi:hypothetical protein